MIQPMRTSVSGEPRGFLCGMGVCFECRRKDTHERACILPCPPQPPLPDKTHTLVVGAGPAGIAAALQATRHGVDVAVIDDNPASGGQIWRGQQAEPLLRKFSASGVRLSAGTMIVAAPEPDRLLASNRHGTWPIRYQRLILATGARELFMPFPGWTLPGVTGAGGLQALVKNRLADVAGKRIVVAGSGPLLLAVAAFLTRHGAHVLHIAEQAPFTRASRIGCRKPGQAVQLLWQLRGVRMSWGAWPVRAEGHGRLEHVVLSNGRAFDCDYLATGFGLVPNTDLAELLGCTLQNGFVQVNSSQQTSVGNVYAAGELTGIGGVEKAIAEGHIAGGGNAAVDRSWVHTLQQAFRLDDRLRQVPDDTIVCRCEDVRLGQMRHYANWREAKLQTRCGMGACQGRTCGPIVEWLFGWQRQSVRPPLYPIPVSQLLTQARGSDS